jgi:hypothetical protein
MTKLRHWWGGPPTVRYAWLATTLFDTIEQVQDKAMRWLWTYNHERPNMALGGITPAMKLAMAVELHIWKPLEAGDCLGLASVRDRQGRRCVRRLGASACHALSHRFESQIHVLRVIADRIAFCSQQCPHHARKMMTPDAA